MEKPYLLAVPVVVLLLVGFGVSRLRGRKRESETGTDEVAPASLATSGGKKTAPGTFSPTQTDAGTRPGGNGDGEEVDPLEEAEIFLAYGRDAQAEDLLKEALESHPARYDIHAKLLEIYATRGDKQAFETLAREVQKGTGGEGEIWDRVVGLGYSIDPGNPRYAAGKSSQSGGAARASSLTSANDRLDLEVGLGDGAAPDFDPSAEPEFERSPVFDPDATMEGLFDTDDDATTIQIRSNTGFTETDLDLSSDAGLTATDLDLGDDLPDLDIGQLVKKPDAGESTMDFNMGDHLEAETPSAAPSAAESDDTGLEFNMDGISLDSGGAGEDKAYSESSSDMPALDLSGISLDLDGATGAQTASADKDEKWYEVQTKFDLAKAYQEMGDVEGARELLQEVLKDGDAAQQAAAQAILAGLRE